jgi:hypothetical protein
LVPVYLSLRITKYDLFFFFVYHPLNPASHLLTLSLSFPEHLN